MKFRRTLLLAVAFGPPLTALPNPGPFGASPPIVQPGPARIPSDPDRWLPWRIFTWRDGVKPGASALAQDAQGYVWAGAQDGLVRYNGQSWQRVEVPGKPAPVFAIVGRRDGSLWIGKPPDHQFYRLKNGAWTVFDQRSGMPPGIVEALTETVEGERGTLWAGTSLGLSRCRGDVCTEMMALRGHTVRALAPTRSGDGRLALWIGTSRGLLRLDDADTDQPRLSPLFADPAVLPSASLRSLAETVGKDGRRSLWVGTDLGMVRLRDGIWARYDGDSGFPSGPILTFVVCRGADGEPVVWAGSFRSGLFRFADDGRWQLFDEHSGLPANFVLSLLSTGTDGTDPALWVITPAALARLDRERWHSTDTRAGLPNDLVTGVGEVTFPDGLRSFWIGTIGGMARLTSQGWERYSPMPGPPDVVLQAINSREEDGTPSLWLGSLEGLLHFAHGRWSRIDSRTSPLPHNWVFSVLAVPGPRGSEIWAGTLEGVARYAGGRWTVFRSGDAGLPGRDVRTLVRSTPDGVSPILWAGTENGLARFEAETWRPVRVPCLPDPTVESLQILDGADGRWLWVVARVGLARMRLDAAGSLQEPCQAMVDDPSALSHDSAQVQADSYGRIYLFTDRGVRRLTLDPVKGLAAAQVETFDTGDGLPSMDFSGPSFKDPMGRIWGGATGGAATLDPVPPLRVKAPHPGAPLLIEHVKVAGRERPLASGAVLRHDENSLELQFALLSYRREHATIYRTQLAGLEDEPMPWTPESRVVYNRLPQGDYTFRVWGRDGEGTVSGPVVVSFRVRPAPWLNTWAIALYAIALLGIVWGVSHLRVKALARRAALLEAVVTERTRELAEANQKLEQASLTDPLTGLSNRRFLDLNIGADLSQAVRNAQQLLALRDRNADLIFYFIDLDHFKRLNDWIGHAAGDAVLVELGHRLREVARTTDAVVRWGGEEFLVVSRWANRRTGGVLAARTLEAVAAEPFIVDGQPVHITCSVGWVPYPWSIVNPESLPFEEVLSLADRALYLAKQEGRNCAVGVLPGPANQAGEPLPEGSLKAVEGHLVELVRHQGPEVVPSFAPATTDSAQARITLRAR
ncbi:MAG TPA: diguanylate cyclase [Thermoanaerobaculia bacterium]|jgi:diguanylate cyclase (GGDEF)-like protein|nr:diguanylate cyclase [Thermoanaerobaculia bacterium]